MCFSAYLFVCLSGLVFLSLSSVSSLFFAFCRCRSRLYSLSLFFVYVQCPPLHPERASFTGVDLPVLWGVALISTDTDTLFLAYIHLMDYLFFSYLLVGCIVNECRTCLAMRFRVENLRVNERFGGVHVIDTKEWGGPDDGISRA